MWTRRDFLWTIASLPLAGLTGCTTLPPPERTSTEEKDVHFSESGTSSFGEWKADVSISPGFWQPGVPIRVGLVLHLSDGMLQGLAASAGIAPEALLVLITSERSFDAGGFLHLPADELMSTLLTPSGLAIEGGSSGAISQKTGSRYLNPVDRLLRLPLASLRDGVRAEECFQLPRDIPPGIYRLRLDFGVEAGKRRFSFNARQGFAGRSPDARVFSFLYSPPVACDGVDVSGRRVKARSITRRIYWVLLGQYNSNGSRGVVADEDRGHFALSDRHIIHDEVILPLFDAQGKRISYNLEPVFAADMADPQRSIPWDYSSGELSIRVTDPSGRTADLGAYPFKEKRGNGATTLSPLFGAWKPSGYGLHTATARGWIADRWGNRYLGGGTYRFWIAKRMTMATATFQGMAFPVGTAYGRDIAFAPAVPADVKVKVDFYPGSDRKKAASVTYAGRATHGGIFGVAQGLAPFPLDAPGEYHAHVLATYTDREGHLWVCSLRHAGVVYPESTRLVAHGKKVKVGDRLLDRGETRYEGFIEENDGFRHLDHINFPYRSGDVLLIASEGKGANKIEPVLTYAFKDNDVPYDPNLQPIGATNVRIETSNGMSPHLYPEYITDWSYYYAAAPRPGFSSRFLVGEDGVRAPYWPTSATNFGGQIGASSNGDQPGDIYRLLGGVVVRFQDKTPLYAGYLSSAFILPGGTKNNRVIPAGSEALTGADGKKARFFLVPVRPGMVYEQGTLFAPALQVDPIVPARINFTLRYPDGRTRSAEGTADRFGAFAGKERWPLDQPGVYVYQVKSSWAGQEGRVPGLPGEGGFVFVAEKTRPPGALGLRLSLPGRRSFGVEQGLRVEGFSNGDTVYFAAVTPGAIVDQGKIPVRDGSFGYHLDPERINRLIPIYDIVNLRSGRKEIGRVIHLTFFSRERGPDGTMYHAFTRLIIRGTTALYLP